MSRKNIQNSENNTISGIAPRLNTVILFLFLLFISTLYASPLLSAQSSDDPELTETENSLPESTGQFASDIEEEEISEKIEDSPEAEDSEDQSNWVDDYYDKTNIYIHNMVFKADDFLGEEQEEDLPTLTRSRFNFAIDAKIEDNNGRQFSMDLDFRADIKLPKTKERFGLFINTSAPDELPGEDPDDVQNPLLVGLELISAFRRFPYLSSVAGVRVNRSPAFFTGITFKPHFEWETFHVIPQQKVFWFSDETGLGGLTSLRLDWLAREDLLLRSLSAARYNEATEGIEWEQTFMIGFSTKGTFKDLDRGHGIKFSVFGHKTGSTGIIDYYRIAYIYRRNIYKKWLFIQGGPEARFRNEDDWEIAPGFRIGLDVLFWTPEDIDA